MTDDEIIDGFQTIRDFAEFCFKRLEDTLDEKLGAVDHHTMRKITSLEADLLDFRKRLAAVEKNLENR